MILGGRTVATLIEIPGVYDGWSVALLDDGTMWNRWATEDQTGPREGHERQWAETVTWIDGGL